MESVPSSLIDSLTAQKVLSDEVLRVVSEFLGYHRSMQFEKAREVVDSERLRLGNISSTHKSVLSIWHNLLGILSQIGILESSYYSLNMFLAKFTFRKDNHIRDVYVQMRNELQKCSTEANAPMPYAISKDEDFVLKKLLFNISNQLLQFIVTRIDFIDFYVSLSSRGWMDIAETSIKRIAEIGNALEFNRRARTGNDIDICEICVKEISILRQLFEVHQHISGCNMFDALIALKTLRNDLSKWFSQFECGLTVKPTTSFLFSFTKKAKSSEKLALPLFFNQFYQGLLAKFSLYYHDILSPYMPSAELKAAFTNTNRVLHSIQNFYRKSSPQIICLMVSRIDLQSPFYGFGYHHFLSGFNNDYCKPASGMQEKYPTLFVFPQEKRTFDAYYVNILIFVQEIFLSQSANVIATSNSATNSSTTNSSDTKIKYLYDYSKDQTFFATNVETNIYMAVAYDRKVQERESIVVNFFNETLSSLRFVKLFQDLRNSSKSL